MKVYQVMEITSTKVYSIVIVKSKELAATIKRQINKGIYPLYKDVTKGASILILEHNIDQYKRQEIL